MLQTGAVHRMPREPELGEAAFALEQTLVSAFHGYVEKMAPVEGDHGPAFAAIVGSRRGSRYSPVLRRLLVSIDGRGVASRAVRAFGDFCLAAWRLK